MRARLSFACDLSLLVGIRLIVSWALLALGFSHISDDDFSRTVLAQTFAVAPRLDPTGTSWLPLPFWLTGGAMMVFGRSLDAARAIAIALGALSAALPYVPLRSLGLPRNVALFACAVALTIPWGAWTSAAMVPEGWVANLTVTAVLLAIHPEPSIRMKHAPFAAFLLLLASLARYDAWPFALLFGVLTLADGFQGHRRVALLSALASALGPALWILWNAKAHGDPFHFLHRVSAFRLAVGAAAEPIVAKVLGSPRALFFGIPTATVSTAVLALHGFGLGARNLVLRFGRPLLFVLASMLFLVVGDLSDGAPTHHPERALLPAASILFFAATLALRDFPSVLRVGIPLGVVLLHGATFAHFPGRAPEASRSEAIRRGLALFSRGSPPIRVTPCRYEHFALLSAYAAPERATILAADPSLPAIPREAHCPRVDVTGE